MTSMIFNNKYIISYDEKESKFKNVQNNISSELLNLTGSNNNIVTYTNNNKCNELIFFDLEKNKINFKYDSMCIFNGMCSKYWHIIVKFNQVLCFHNKKLRKTIDIHNSVNYTTYLTNHGKLITLGKNIGHIVIHNCADEKYVFEDVNVKIEEIKITDTEIKNIVASDNGKLVAIVCDQGRSIKIYDMIENKIIKKFVRGIQCALIHDIKFINNDNELACISDTGTLHIFDLKIENNKNIKSYLSYFINTENEWSFVKYYTGFKNKSYLVYTSDDILHVICANKKCIRLNGLNYEKIDTCTLEL